jgi:hypothetical protein
MNNRLSILEVCAHAAIIVVRHEIDVTSVGKVQADVSLSKGKQTANLHPGGTRQALRRQHRLLLPKLRVERDSLTSSFIIAARGAPFWFISSAPYSVPSPHKLARQATPLR